MEMILGRVKSQMISQSFYVNDSWLSECIAYCCTQTSQINEDKIQKFVKEQYLLSDLREINNINGNLPANLSQQKEITLTNKYTLQLLKLYDISLPKFKQLEKIRNISTVNIEATNDNSQAWEPTGKRVLQLFLTDGVQEVLAIEYKPIRVLNDSLYPGLKIMIMGPVTCRRGVILLEETNVSIRGGEVDDLLIPNALENVLANALNLPLTQDPYNDTNKNKEPEKATNFEDDFNIDLAEIEQIERLEKAAPPRRETSNQNSSSNTNLSAVNNSFQNNRNSAPPKNKFPMVQDISEFPEDDDLLFEELEIDEGFSSTSNKSANKAVSKFSESKPSTSSNSIDFPDDDFDLGDVDFDSGLTWSEPTKNKNNEAKSRSRQSISELNITKEVVTGGKRSAVQLSPVQSSAKIPCSEGAISGTANRKITDFLGGKKEEMPRKICDYISDVTAMSLTSCPIRKTVSGKVMAIGKLTKKDLRWILDGTITDQSGKMQVDFSSQFMESLLGMSVEEFSQLKKRIKTNPELEEQLRKKMLDGQNKLQEMESLMELELKRGAKPVVLSFSELTQTQKDAHDKRFKMLKSQNQL